MANCINVSGISLYAYHGCLDEEAIIGGHYIVDVQIKTNFTKSFTTDELSDTIDYVLITQIVKEEMAVRSKLIEHVGNRIVKRFEKELKGVIQVKLKVVKLSPPIEANVHSVSIEIEEVFKS